MARPSKRQSRENDELLAQLKWECYRLNPQFRLYCDSNIKVTKEVQEYCRNHDVVEEEAIEAIGYKPVKDLAFPISELTNPMLFLPYKEKNLKKAIKLRDRSFLPDIIKMKMRAVYVNLPNFLTQDNALKHFKTSFNAFSKNKIDSKDSMEAFLREPLINISFALDTSKKDLLKTVDDVFGKIENFKKLIMTKRKPKATFIRDALAIYEQVTYKKMSLQQIAKREQTNHDHSYTAAYNRVKKRYKAAKHLIEKGGYQGI